MLSITPPYSGRRVLSSHLRAMVAGVMLVATALGFAPVQARESVKSDTITLAELPREGRTVYRRILEGGPFAYDKDGTVFFNRERLLPVQQRGYYREYTVARPGARNRGARRIVCGGFTPTAPDGCYYTSDHYASFKKIAP